MKDFQFSESKHLLQISKHKESWKYAIFSWKWDGWVWFWFFALETEKVTSLRALHENYINDLFDVRRARSKGHTGL